MNDGLEALLASRVPLIVAESRDEQRMLDLLRTASLRVRLPRGWGVFAWSATEGLRRIDVDLGGPQRSLAEPGAMLRHLKATTAPGIYILVDFHPWLAEPVHVRLLKDIAQSYGDCARTVVLVSHEIALPPELEPLAARFRLALPSAAERRAIIDEVLAAGRAAHPARAQAPDPTLVTRLVEHLAGLAASDAERLARRVILDDGALGASELAGVQAARVELLNRGGVLAYEPDTARFAHVGGLRALRRWLDARRAAFDGQAPGLDAPRGVLLLGVQGCGKSLAARATAALFDVALLRCDFGALFSKWHGESERNLRESLAAAEALSPCVLWIDEIEKAIASGDGDSGTSRRMLGTFLTWLAGPRQRVFVVATANDIAALPPELVRKGRFDEIFFVDLPDAVARVEILGIHTSRRGITLPREALARLAARAADFSGAELEQAVVSAQYAAHAAGVAPDEPLIAAEIRATRPLSVVMAEQVAALRAWARDRTVPAD